MLKIGITGGIGSGKSLVSQAFTLLQVPVYNADLRAKLLIANDVAVKTQITALLGQNAYNEVGEYDRKYVAEIVFNDANLLKKLNEIVHPAVHTDARLWFDANKWAAYVIYEAAIMNHAGDGNELDFVVAVIADKATRIRRILSRDTHRSAAAIQEIMRNQKSTSQFREIADFVIHNNDTDLVLEQVFSLHANLITL